MANEPDNETGTIPPAERNDSVADTMQRIDKAIVDAVLGVDLPALPQGDTSLPMWPIENPTWKVVATTPVEQLTPNDEFLGALGTLPKEQQDIIMQWFPFVWHTNSVYLEGIQVRTPQHILAHIEGYTKAQQAELRERERVSKIEEREARTAQRQEKSDKGTLWAMWVESCRLRKEWIAGKKAEWERRRAERAKVQAAWQEQMDKALAEWNVYVNTAEVEYKTAKATPPPPRP